MKVFERFKAVIVDTFLSLASNKADIFKLSLVPLVLIFAVGSLKSYTHDSGLRVTIDVLNTYFFSLWAVRVHRLILIGPDSIPSLWTVMPSKAVIKYLIYIIIFMMISTLFSASMFIFNLMGLMRYYAYLTSGQGSVVAIVAILYITFVVYGFSRVALIFPSIAIDKALTFRTAWKATSQNKGLSFFVVILFPIILFLLIAWLIHLIKLPVLGTVLLTLWLLVCIVILSKLYQEISENIELLQLQLGKGVE